MHSTNTEKTCSAHSSHSHRNTTDPRGRSFLSYRRSRSEEAALLVRAQHDHGVPTWQDVRDLSSAPTEDEIREVLASARTASAVLLITPEVIDSAMIRNVEIPAIMKRAEARDGFFAVPVVGGDLSYSKAAKVAGNHLSAQNLSDWNMEKTGEASISKSYAATVARRILEQRLSAIHRSFPPDEPLEIGLFVRRPAPLETDLALVIDWSARFSEKETNPDTWSEILIPALRVIEDRIRVVAPGRKIIGSGLPTLPAAVALGCAFLSTSGLELVWNQKTLGQPDQVWSLSSERITTGFSPDIFSKRAEARDIAVLISVTDDVEPVFSSCQAELPAFRALVHVRGPQKLPFSIRSPGEATDLALVTQEGIRTARRRYGNVGVVHLFMAVPAGLAVLIGQVLNTFGAIQTYEHVGADGSGIYKPAALLRPCT